MKRNCIPLCTAIILAGLSGYSAVASAQELAIEESPANWRLQNYLQNDVMVWFTTAPNCFSGRLFFQSNATLDDRNRFWSAVLTAKNSGQKIGIYYTNAGNGVCHINSFYVP